MSTVLFQNCEHITRGHTSCPVLNISQLKPFAQVINIEKMTNLLYFFYSKENYLNIIFNDFNWKLLVL